MFGLFGWLNNKRRYERSPQERNADERRVGFLPAEDADMLLDLFATVLIVPVYATASGAGMAAAVTPGLLLILLASAALDVFAREQRISPSGSAIQSPPEYFPG